MRWLFNVNFAKYKYSKQENKIGNFNRSGITIKVTQIKIEYSQFDRFNNLKDSFYDNLLKNKKD